MYCELLHLGFSGCLQLLDQIPDCVHRVSDIIAVVSTRNGAKWRTAALESLLREVCVNVLD